MAGCASRPTCVRHHHASPTNFRHGCYLPTRNLPTRSGYCYPSRRSCSNGCYCWSGHCSPMKNDCSTKNSNYHGLQSSYDWRCGCCPS